MLDFEKKVDVRYGLCMAIFNEYMKGEINITAFLEEGLY